MDQPDQASKMSRADAVLAPMPTISERLRAMQPSHELLGFYRQKCAEFDGEHADMVEKLERYKKSSEDQHKQAWSLAQREEEIRQLQKALSDMQVYLFQEREHVLRLYAENDRLKILELEDRKKIQHLLGLTAPVEQETTYFQEQHDARLVGARGVAAEMARRAAARDKKIGSSSSGEGAGAAARGNGGAGNALPRRRTKGSATKPDNAAQGLILTDRDRIETLVLTIEALQAQMEDNARVAKEKEAAMLEDRRVREEEFRAESARDTEMLQQVTDKLHNTQDLLYDSTRDYLELKYGHRKQEREWIEEKERLLQRIEELKDDMDSYETEMSAALAAAQRPAATAGLGSGGEFVSVRDAGTNAYRPGGRGSSRGGGSEQGDSATMSVGQARAVAAEREQSEQASMAEMYREQCIQLEDELCRLKEERQASVGVQTERSKKLLRRLDLMKSRYEKLDRRRLLEAEGYKSSIKILRKRLTQVERHIYRLAAQWSGNDDEQKVLGSVQQSTARSKKVLGELQQLKSRIVAAERGVHDLR